jgi:two-component system cell cycle response regulator DivK
MSRADILIAEDDALSLKLMKDALEARGYAIRSTTSGQQVLTLAAERLPALIVMDIGLPDTDGIEVTRALKADPRSRRIPVVAVTAYAMPGDEQRMREAGCDAYLTKPLRFAEFVAVVERLASSRSS